MKIAVLTASFLPRVGGAQVFAYNISRQLAAVGNDVRVYVPREDFSRLGPQFTNLLMPLPRKFYGVARRVPFLGLYRAQRYLAK